MSFTMLNHDRRGTKSVSGWTLCFCPDNILLMRSAEYYIWPILAWQACGPVIPSSSHCQAWLPYLCWESIKAIEGHGIDLILQNLGNAPIHTSIVLTDTILCYLRLSYCIAFHVHRRATETTLSGAFVCVVLVVVVVGGRTSSALGMTSCLVKMHM